MKTVDLSDKVKYPRSYHLPFSPGATSDDKKWTNEQAIAYTTGKDLVVTEKLDGTCFEVACKTVSAQRILVEVEKMCL